MPTFTLPAPPAINGDHLTGELAVALGVDEAELIVTYAGHDPSAPTVEVTAPEGVSADVVASTVTAHRPPPSLTTDRTTVPPDGTTVATVTYTNLRSDAPARVNFDVNGTVKDVALSAAGNAILEVASATPGDVVRVSVADAGTVTITVEEA